MSGSAVNKIREIVSKPDIEGVKSGKIATIEKDGVVFIDFSGNRQGPIPARVTSTMVESISSRSDHTDLAVLIAFEENDATRPVIVDVIHDRIEKPASAISIDRSELDDVRIDGETVTFSAKKEIVLRCGNSSITLTHAGKVLIRGSYLLNRSSGVNKIKGGSVQIN